VTAGRAARLRVRYPVRRKLHIGDFFPDQEKRLRFFARNCRSRKGFLLCRLRRRVGVTRVRKWGGDGGV
jgi:hypothetical protein